MANPVAELKKVGAAKLEIFFFDIYFSTLFSADGNYQENTFPIALKIKYLRDIKSKDLLERTQQEWQKLGYSDEDTQPWLEKLATMWPNINKHDELTLLVQSDGTSEFYLNDEAIGEIQDTKFGRHFLAIWLDKNCSYPKLRKQLIGGE
ncbi:chalcone isomerase family protein [Aliiglaciecola lipolytica]|uniref:Chalcone isomerase domain-containing protein n=1 Tax=Aliiglaciecola lipolytica E3 TaxID=1127673 RepID=K6YCH7_9ALTE|nr:chalcone isomerase family protein [Aliiglaciecola lipolytica]GAC15892.1 conserved hypothetical protein [Aliiglaciecola lipolytica E3]